MDVMSVMALPGIHPKSPKSAATVDMEMVDSSDDDGEIPCSHASSKQAPSLPSNALQSLQQILKVLPTKKHETLHCTMYLYPPNRNP